MASANSGSVIIVAGLEFTEYYAVPLLFEGLQSLGSGIVELTGLAYDDGSGPDQKD